MVCLAPGGTLGARSRYNPHPLTTGRGEAKQSADLAVLVINPEVTLIDRNGKRDGLQAIGSRHQGQVAAMQRLADFNSTG